jgi:hypothetical protein
MFAGVINTRLLFLTLSVSRPTLRPPPPLTPEGTIVEPIPEKSFFEKYWMYLLAAGLMIRKSTSLTHHHHIFIFVPVISGAAPDEGEMARRRRD